MGYWGIEVWGLVWECTRVECWRGRAEKCGGMAAESEAEAKTWRSEGSTSPGVCGGRRMRKQVPGEECPRAGGQGGCGCPS